MTKFEWRIGGGAGKRLITACGCQDNPHHTLVRGEAGGNEMPAWPASAGLSFCVGIDSRQPEFFAHAVQFGFGGVGPLAFSFGALAFLLSAQ